MIDIESRRQKPSTLILAMKRSGTNWVHDTLAPHAISSVNEPLGLHYDTDLANPLNPWNFSSRKDVSAKYGQRRLAPFPYNSLMTRSLLGWVKDGGKLIKETDFLYADWLLQSVPLKTLVLQRDPRSSIASYKKYGLYDKWRFDEKMDHFEQTIYETPELDARYGNIFEPQSQTETPFHQRLAYYYLIGFLELARVTQNADAMMAKYEELVDNPLTKFQEIFAFLDFLWSSEDEQRIIARTNTTRDVGPHGTFRAKQDLFPFSQVLSQTEEQDIRTIFANGGVALEPPTGTATFIRKEHKKTVSIERVEEVSRNDEIERARNGSVSYELDYPLGIAKTLVTNREYAKFLSWMRQKGFPLSVKGLPLFYNDRPQGSIRNNNGSIFIESDYADHPVNFVNWIGAAAYTLWVGGRLPTAQEWRQAICPDEIAIFESKKDIDPESANVGQLRNGSTPVTFFPPNEKGIYDAVGNSSIWLNDSENSTAYDMNKAGLEWNHTKDRGFYPNPRPYWLGTSGLGIRTVFSSANPLSDSEYISKMKSIVEFLTDVHHEDVEIANRQVFAFFDTLFYAQS